jgi:hypothetical protein
LTLNGKIFLVTPKNEQHLLPIFDAMASSSIDMPAE